ncbi:hypothetical protein KSZ_37160 [Dictyobacter formicarum]|uniref:IstB-like ATP-binding protein domain-containing protein n=1 Tax=Dictyobacter formicarum TaxID=2778368 RepID=A0ABQ3VIV7_9CHLR|nr:hypothetical protein KSZ_37160 [Dictyobacter formicarum]
MQPEVWQPPIALSTQEEQIVTRIRRAKLFVFLRKHQHVLFDEAFQRELANLYDDSLRHGRKSRSVRVDGYKRHVLQDLDTNLIRAVGSDSSKCP